MREGVASDEEKGIAAVVLCLGEGRRSIYLVLILPFQSNLCNH